MSNVVEIDVKVASLGVIPFLVVTDSSSEVLTGHDGTPFVNVAISDIEDTGAVSNSFCGFDVVSRDHSDADVLLGGALGLDLVLIIRMSVCDELDGALNIIMERILKPEGGEIDKVLFNFCSEVL